MQKNDDNKTSKSGEITDILYGSETAKALTNFTISELKMPRAFLWALATIKSACAQANQELGLLDADKSAAIQVAAKEVADGFHLNQFPIDVFQTGSGTSTNMNVNEVIASLVKRHSQQKITLHPNDDVNMGQSSNDVIPSCIHLSAAKLISDELLPSLQHLSDTLDAKASEHHNTIKTGRTHLMDAMPLSFAQEISGWSSQISYANDQLKNSLPSLCKLAIGGTAIGTGVNTHPEFAAIVTRVLSERTGLTLSPADNYFRAISAQDTAVQISGMLKTTAVSLSKVSNDIRWLSSGPLNGLNELQLPELQKGSSIMPGKVNPVIPEAVLMACTQVIGNDTTITLAGQSGNFQLNTMLPLIGHTLLQSIQLLSSSSSALADKVIKDMQVNHIMINENLVRNPILATALTNLIGYDKSAEIAKKAHQEKRTVLDVALELTDISETELIALLDPKRLTGG
ncbi:class II fumarate hydratase [Colwellia sp. MB02u-18]|uniref:class II fumarate hydratase n=1 Tax=unclassified Colwellia TaxID=196834 RepID=UPI0015F65455|nr:MULTISPECIES: class II fumarate hydratase [unclassified Colwellia]MBA6223640.1 class II fumarate hydratase [Colwellia sp. MB3u-45]MBA6267294.1 class II fumarate hydratase [Colwellia sp. MB3u-43]MBA6319821.1 class II fumarate hydratase [Colwellia sp. MB02u-19]MBA6323800.1 class II fumarate hydratase [Colwellia sp. MB02u-18]MBA6330790.1 class II fumarate hydratase [Colwellia sp. MB02u-12]